MIRKTLLALTLASLAMTPASSAKPQQPPQRGTRPPATTPAANGARLYQLHCAACHGANRTGGFAPDLRTQHAKRTPAMIAQLIAAPPAGMPKLSPTPLSPAQARMVADYVHAGK